MTVPDQVAEVGESAFEVCSKLETVRLPKGMTRISDRMFYRCSALKEFPVTEGVTAIGANAFGLCSALEDAALPESLTELRSNAFWLCSSIKKIVIPESLTAISDGAFSNCSAVEQLVLPAGLKSIGNGAFSGCNKLQYVLYGGSIEQWDQVSGTKPETPSYKNAILLCGCKSSKEDGQSDTWKTMPQSCSAAIGEDVTDRLKAEIEAPQEGGSFYTVWYKNTSSTTENGERIVGSGKTGKTENSCTPSADTKGVAYYYCMAVRVDSQGQASWSWSDVASVSVGMDDFTGAGTADNPYQLSTADDLEKLRNLVASGMSMENTYLQMTADITLPKSWKPIGVKKNAALDTIDKGNNLCAFSGIFDGAGHKITVAEGGLPLFGYVRGSRNPQPEHLRQQNRRIRPDQQHGRGRLIRKGSPH